MSIVNILLIISTIIFTIMLIGGICTKDTAFGRTSGRVLTRLFIVFGAVFSAFSIVELIYLNLNHGQQLIMHQVMTDIVLVFGCISLFGTISAILKK